MENRDLPEVPGFRILGELGRGGSARVFSAEKPDGQRFALKVFHSAGADQGDFRRRILGEWKAAAAPEEAGLVRIHDLLEAAGHTVLVMDYVEGTSLADFQSRLPYVLPEMSALIAVEILKALEGIHGRGIVHRDLKPSNVLVEKTGKILVTDFGLAKWSDASAYTLHGAVLGSPDFMSPEQAQGDVVTPQSDLFSVASLLYFLVTGTRPFSRSSPLATLAAVVKGEFEPAGRRNPKISPALSRILQKGMSPQPRDRFASAGEFRQTLERYLAQVGFPEYLTLSLWCAKPAESTMAALQAIAEKLAASGRSFLDQGDRERATETISHLSLVAPDSMAVQELLDRLEHSGRKRGFVYWVAAAALALLLGSSAFNVYRNSNLPIENMSAGSLEVAPAPTPILEPTSEEKKVVPTRKIRSVAKNKTPERRPAPQRINFTVPEDVEVEWNGIAVQLDKPFFALPGRHDLLIRKEGFRPISRQIEVSRDEPTVIRVN